MVQRLDSSFFYNDVLEVAPGLLGKKLVRKFPDNTVIKLTITETEAYRGEEDLACHASRGITERNKIMYSEGGYVYVYLIYGLYWMLNFVTGSKNNPQAVLIRGLEDFNGPGKLTRHLQINKSFNGENIGASERLWVESVNNKVDFTTGPRIGIDYAGEIWKNKPWRFVLKNIQDIH